MHCSQPTQAHLGLAVRWRAAVELGGDFRDVPWQELNPALIGCVSQASGNCIGDRLSTHAVPGVVRMQILDKLKEKNGGKMSAPRKPPFRGPRKLDFLDARSNAAGIESSQSAAISTKHLSPHLICFQSFLSLSFFAQRVCTFAFANFVKYHRFHFW